MWRKDEMFTVSEPGGRGRVIGSRPEIDPRERPVKDTPKVSVEDLRQVLAEAVLKETELPPLDSSLKNLPFEGAKKLAILRALETYLMAQLVQVRKEIEKVTQESIPD